MVVHHIVTVLLLIFSYYSGFFRIGSIIVLLHDLADIFLEVGSAGCHQPNKDCISRWKVGFITNYYSGHFAGGSKTVPSRVMEIEPNGGSMPTWDSYCWVYNPGDPGLS